MKKTGVLSPSWLYIALAIALFLLMKGGYAMAQVEQLHFLLYPTSQLVALFSGTEAAFLPGQGYYNADLNILINKSCSGFNFWVLCFVMIYCLLEKKEGSHLSHMLAIPVTLFFTYLFSLLVNTTRILFSIFLHAENIRGLSADLPWAHQAEGVFVYLSYLILAYLSVDFLQTQKRATL